MSGPFEKNKGLILVELTVAIIMLIIFTITFIPFGINFSRIDNVLLQTTLGLISIPLGFATGLALGRNKATAMKIMYTLVFGFCFAVIFYLTFFLLSSPLMRL